MRLVMIAAVLFAGAMQAGPAAPVYDVSFVLEQGTYTGTTTFSVSRAGAVTGTMKLTDPITVDGTLGGTVKEGTWTFDFPYTIQEQNCSGTVKGTAKVPADRKVISGSVVIAGACVETPTDATFTLTQRAAEKK